VKVKTKVTVGADAEVEVQVMGTVYEGETRKTREGWATSCNGGDGGTVDGKRRWLTGATGVGGARRT